MQVRDRHANEHTALKRLGGNFTDRKKYVTWGLKLQKFYVFFPCYPMEPFISGVRP